MRRLFALLAAIPLALLTTQVQVATADTVTPVQDKPEVTITGPFLVEVDGDGYTVGGTAVTALRPGKQGGTPADSDRPIFQVDVKVQTNGELNSITVVGLCVFQDPATSILESNGDLATRCGFPEDGNGVSEADSGDGENNQTDGPASISPDSTLALTYFGGDTDGDGSAEAVSEGDTITVDVGSDTTEDVAYGYRNEGTNEHRILEPVVATDTTTDGAYYKTVSFRFQVSHAAANSANDWHIRAVAVTQPPTITDGNPAAQDTQWTQAITPSADGTGLDMLYYGSMTGARAQQAFGALAPEVSKTVSAITTGDYYANDESQITLSGTDFTIDTDSDQTADDTLALADSANNQSDPVTVQLQCQEEETPSDGTDLDTAINVSNGNQALLTEVPASNGSGSEDAATASKHDCTLDYQGGALFGNQEYSNTITVGIFDSADTPSDYPDATESGEYFDAAG